MFQYKANLYLVCNFLHIYVVIKFKWVIFMENKKILIIEAENLISKTICESLHKEGFNAIAIKEGKKALYFLRKYKPDMLVLDLNIPDINGIEICKVVAREFVIPIVTITDMEDITEKILAIELGADDYISKPFDIREFTVKVKAIFRRMKLCNKNNNEELCKVLNLKKQIIIYKEQRAVLKNSTEIKLTNKEFDLLVFLAENRGRVFYRQELLEKVWGFEFVGGTRTVDIHIQRIRKKLKENKENSIIETVFGVGYKMIE